jgi:hypothetical protein
MPNPGKMICVMQKEISTLFDRRQDRIFGQNVQGNNSLRTRRVKLFDYERNGYDVILPEFYLARKATFLRLKITMSFQGRTNRVLSNIVTIQWV